MHGISAQDSNANDKRHRVKSAPVYGDAPDAEELREEDKGGWLTPERIVLATCVHWKQGVLGAKRIYAAWLYDGEWWRTRRRRAWQLRRRISE